MNSIRVKQVVRARLETFEAALARPVDIAWLVAFRVLLGLLLAISMERFIHYGWIDSLLVGPTFRFKYYGFGWVEPLPRDAMLWLFRGLVGLGLCVAAGFCFRVAAPLLALGLTYVQLIDVSTYLNHYYLAALLAWLLSVSPAHRAGSIDAWFGRRWARARGREASSFESVPAAWLYLLRVQVGLVYVCAGFAKLQTDWLIHAQPLRIWLGANTELPLLGRVFTWPGVPLAMSWFGFLFDTTIVGFLLARRTRPVAYLVVVAFHVMTRLLFDIGMFPAIMSAAALVFFSPSWPRVLGSRLGARWGRWTRRSSSSASSAAVEAGQSERFSVGGRVAVALGVLYVVVQVCLPLRSTLYGGNVLWHEQGMRFSWRVMVRAKGGAATFYVTRPGEEREIPVDPRRYLTRFQENEMAGQPDLILQMAHHIGREFETRGSGPVRVRVDTHVSLNGRRAIPLIDPSVDLMNIHDGLGPASWILPAPTSPPPHTRPVL